MNSRRIAIALMLLVSLTVTGMLHAQVSVPPVIRYQGRISKNGVNHQGPLLFKFALVNAAGTSTFWSNDGVNPPNAPVTLDVTDGLFVVVLGDVSLPGMTQTIPTSVFDNRDVHLRIWVGDPGSPATFEQLSPDQRVGSVGYAMLSAGVINGAIGANKLAEDAVSADKIQNGAITAEKLAPGAVTGSLPPSLDLGAAGVCGLLDVFSTDIGTPGVTIDGCLSEISAFVHSSGVEGVEIAATGNGGVMTLRNSSGSTRLQGGSEGNNGYLQLYAGSAPLLLSSVSLDAEDSNGGGSLFLSTPSVGPFLTRDSLTLAAQNAEGVPELAMAVAAGLGSSKTTVQFSGDGKLLLSRTSGTNTVEIHGAANNSSQGAAMWLRNARGTNTILFDAEEGDDRGGLISIRNGNGVETIEIDGDRGSTSARGFIALSKNDGSATIILDADDSGAGRITTDVLQINGADFSEKFDIKPVHDELEPGMIVCIDPDNPGRLVTSSKAYDTTVAGIISGAGGVRTGMLMGHPGTLADGQHPVALTGRVYCMMDADQGAIRPGDLITTSDRPGHGMKVNDATKAHGAIIGKAMTRLDRGNGLVLVLVSLQ